jgi:hypothetical protein
LLSASAALFPSAALFWDCPNPGAPLASTDRVVSVFGQDAHREAGPLSYQDYQSLPTSGFEWISAARILPGTIAWDGQSAIIPVTAVTPRAIPGVGIASASLFHWTTRSLK